ncbi:hypothetical protein DXX93_14530 [Thalassotalea euphylliae]|uniref:Uncharacterized protein n=1 Tax=Thalassotalea euphylliae TaxID=1655234 RepID=A0A3E0TSM6_9GAMM|nr:hypothetical protein [Thalassotalea euphylliae]REL27651.1 hypothetical protein DXX93_14530 [Thalassotalea euphylliae]
MPQMTLAILFLIFTSIAFAEDEAEQLPPLDPAYEGIHGMVLMNKNSTIFASHMPLFQKPHDYQIVYKLSVKDVNLAQLVKHNELVTIKPEKFNLQRMIRGEKLVLKADVYTGHFERDGDLVYEGMMIELDEQLFVRPLTELSAASNIQEYSAVPYNSKSGRLYIHHIQQAPSYDHILHVDIEASCPTKFATSSSVAKENEILYKLINCGTMKPLYYETQDFAGRAGH